MVGSAARFGTDVDKYEIPSLGIDEGYGEDMDDIKAYILIVGEENRNVIDEIPGMFSQANVVLYLPDSAWMILDCKERFIFYSKGA